VALENDYRAYQDVLAVGVRILHPHAEVKTAELETLEEEIKRFEPQVLICDRPEPLDSGRWGAWLEISVDPTRPTKISAGEHSCEKTNPTMEELLAMIDEIEQYL
jgi:hypothetical protein